MWIVFMHVLVNKLVHAKWHDDGSKYLAVKTTSKKKTMTSLQTDEIAPYLNST